MLYSIILFALLVFEEMNKYFRRKGHELESLG